LPNFFRAQDLLAPLNYFVEAQSYSVPRSQATIILVCGHTGVRVPVGSRILSSPLRPNRLWGPPNLLSNGYRRLFPRGLSGRGVKLTTHLQLVPRSRKCGPIHPLPHTLSWRSAQLVKHRDNFAFFFSYTLAVMRRNGRP
jgi:hypothetical protein